MKKCRDCKHCYRSVFSPLSGAYDLCGRPNAPDDAFCDIERLFEGPCGRAGTLWEPCTWRDRLTHWWGPGTTREAMRLPEEARNQDPATDTPMKAVRKAATGSRVSWNGDLWLVVWNVPGGKVVVRNIKTNRERLLWPQTCVEVE